MHSELTGEGSVAVAVGVRDMKHVTDNRQQATGDRQHITFDV